MLVQVGRILLIEIRWKGVGGIDLLRITDLIIKARDMLLRRRRRLLGRRRLFGGKISPRLGAGLPARAWPLVRDLTITKLCVISVLSFARIRSGPTWGISVSCSRAAIRMPWRGHHRPLDTRASRLWLGRPTSAVAQHDIDGAHTAAHTSASDAAHDSGLCQALIPRTIINLADRQIAGDLFVTGLQRFFQAFTRSAKSNASNNISDTAPSRPLAGSEHILAQAREAGCDSAS